MAAPSHTHNKHTPSPVRRNHTTQREHINYRCTLNYFHYLPCSVVRTKTGMMDGKGFVISPQVANVPSFTFPNPFPSMLFFFYICISSSVFGGCITLFVLFSLRDSFLFSNWEQNIMFVVFVILERVKLVEVALRRYEVVIIAFLGFNTEGTKWLQSFITNFDNPKVKFVKLPNLF